VLEPNQIVTETYILLGTFSSEEEADNCLSYCRTRFFRFLVSLRSSTQDITKERFVFVPIQDFSRPWTDADLYAKYHLTDEEIAFIKSMIRPMELETDA
jgi:site-specific DNA-methyltransferase (adenine-specific)